MGSSTLINGSGWGESGHAMVSPILTSSKPETATISPAHASFISILCNPSNPKSLLTLPLIVFPFSLIKLACWPFFIVPLWIFPITILPKKSESVSYTHLRAHETS